MKNKIMIFIPVYNCENQITRVLSKINQDIQKYIVEIVMVDNRSSDRSIEKAKDFSILTDLKLTILKNNENYNLGGSIKRAFLYAIEKNYDYVISLHGDDQGDIRDLLSILKRSEYENYDLLIGARFHPESTLNGYSMFRKIGNRALNLLCELINRRKVYDLIAGINLFKVDFLKDKFFLKFPDNLTFDAHLLLYAFNTNARLSYFPIVWSEEDQVSNARVIKQGWIILKLFLSYFFIKEKVFLSNKSGHPEGFLYHSEVVFKNE